MKLQCPDCGAVIEPQHINVTTDLAQCGSCGALHRLSALAGGVAAGPALRNEPPAGSSLRLTRELDGLHLYLPRRKGGCGTFFFLGFALFWLSFVAVWTFFAGMAGGAFAAFSIPFWLVGGAMLFGALNSMTETQTLTLTRTRLSIEKKRLLFSRRKEMDLSTIQSIRLEAARSSSFSMPMQTTGWNRGSRYSTPPPVPAILTGEGTTYFFEAASTAEQEWVAAFLQAKLAEHNG